MYEMRGDEKERGREVGDAEQVCNMTMEISRDPG